MSLLFSDENNPTKTSTTVNATIFDSYISLFFMYCYNKLCGTQNSPCTLIICIQNKSEQQHHLIQQNMKIHCKDYILHWYFYPILRNCMYHKFSLLKSKYSKINGFWILPPPPNNNLLSYSIHLKTTLQLQVSRIFFQNSKKERKRWNIVMYTQKAFRRTPFYFIFYLILLYEKQIKRKHFFLQISLSFL